MTRWLVSVAVVVVSAWAAVVVAVRRFDKEGQVVQGTLENVQAPPTMIALPDALSDMLRMPRGSKVPMAGRMLTGVTGVKIHGDVTGTDPPGLDIRSCSRCKGRGQKVQGQPMLCERCIDVLSSVMWAKSTMAHFGLPAHDLQDTELEAAYEGLGTIYKGVARKRFWTDTCMQLISDHQNGRVQG